MRSPSETLISAAGLLISAPLLAISAPQLPIPAPRLLISSPRLLISTPLPLISVPPAPQHHAPAPYQHAPTRLASRLCSLSACPEPLRTAPPLVVSAPRNSNSLPGTNRGSCQSSGSQDCIERPFGGDLPLRDPRPSPTASLDERDVVAYDHHLRPPPEL